MAKQFPCRSLPESLAGFLAVGEGGFKGTERMRCLFCQKGCGFDNKLTCLNDGIPRKPNYFNRLCPGSWQHICLPRGWWGPARLFSSSRLGFLPKKIDEKGNAPFPWSEEREMDRQEAEKRIRRIEEVPTLPVIITRILEVLEDEKSTAKDLERVVSRDQSIASRVLRIANSAYYGFPRRIATIHRAIVILGFETVKALALGSSIFETLFPSGRSTYFNRTAYWLHSIACSQSATALAQESGDTNPQEAFLAGLIHDIGMVAMDHMMHQEYCRLLDRAVQQAVPLHELEREAWGFDHGEVGSWLGERWKFPVPLLDAIRFHHRLSDSASPSTPLVSIVHLADFCSNSAGLGATGNHEDAVFDREALKRTRLGEGDLASLVERIRNEKDRIAAFFSAMSG